MELLETIFLTGDSDLLMPNSGKTWHVGSCEDILHGEDRTALESKMAFLCPVRIRRNKKKKSKSGIKAEDCVEFGHVPL